MRALAAVPFKLELVVLAVLALAILTNAESRTTALAGQAASEFAVLPDSEGLVALAQQIGDATAASIEAGMSLARDLMVLVGRFTSLIPE